VQTAAIASKWRARQFTDCLLPWLFAVAAAELMATALQQQQRRCLLVAAVLLPLACRLAEACCYY
jgi:hypothetical protein